VNLYGRPLRGRPSSSHSLSILRGAPTEATPVQIAHRVRARSGLGEPAANFEGSRFQCLLCSAARLWISSGDTFSMCVAMYQM
jgi:hypothetical protein